MLRSEDRTVWETSVWVHLRRRAAGRVERLLSPQHDVASGHRRVPSRQRARVLLTTARPNVLTLCSRQHGVSTFPLFISG